jgi:anaerobic magnesium-protoporphyrin IX monomethyl ester cyclase
LLYLGAVLREEGFECRYVDLSNSEASGENVVPDADFHLISVQSATFEASKKVMNKVDSGFKVAGGFHASLFPEGTLKELNLDAVVVGEGEEVIATVLRDKIRGVTNGGIIKDLDKIPFPARDLIPLHQLRNLTNIHGDTYTGDGAATTICSSRGCPYLCAFCCKALNQTNFVRYRSAKNVVDELESVATNYDIRHFRFIDDIFTVNRRRVYDLCGLIKDRRLEVYWLCITRTDAVTSDLLKTMHQAGCREIHFGIESGSQRLLDLMNKQTTAETNLKAIRKAKEANLKVKVFLMYGFPPETPEDIELTKKFMIEAQPDKWTLSKFTLLPGSDVQRTPAKYGVHTDFEQQWYYSEEDNPLKQWLRSEVWRI